MANLQVRDINDRLYEALKRRAEMDHRSISQEVVQILESSLGTDMRAETQTLAFLNLTGSWKDKRTAEQIIKDINSSRSKSQRGKLVDELFD